MPSQDDSVNLIADGMAERIINRYAQAAERYVSTASDEDITEDDLISALFELSDNPMNRIAEDGIREAVRMGRADEFSETDVPEGTVWRYSSLLDQNTCSVCEDRDGQEADGPDDDPSEDCLGSESCRCLVYADLTEAVGGQEE